MIHDLRGDLRHSRRTQIHLTIGCADDAADAIVYRNIDRGRVDLQGDEAATRQRQAYRVACRQYRLTLRGADAALIADGGTKERDIAAAGGMNGALVDDAAGGAVAHEAVIAAHKIAVAQAQRTGHHATDVNLGTLPEHDAIRVDDKHAAIAAQLAINLCRVIRLNTV